MTLKFLGDVDDARIPRICEALASASSQLDPFPIRLSGLGCFPAARNARMLWCGIDDPAGGCARWVGSADPLLESLGFEREARAFTHVTLGRGRNLGGSDVLRQVLEGTAAPPAIEMIVEDVVLFESRLSPQGARYAPVRTIRLGEQ